jgi:small subunit ribosomal protein S15e
MSESIAEKKKKAFRKYSYRGVDLDQLLDLSSEAVSAASTVYSYKETIYWQINLTQWM